MMHHDNLCCIHLYKSHPALTPQEAYSKNLLKRIQLLPGCDCTNHCVAPFAAFASAYSESRSMLQNIYPPSPFCCAHLALMHIDFGLSYPIHLLPLYAYIDDAASSNFWVAPPLRKMSAISKYAHVPSVACQMTRVRLEHSYTPVLTQCLVRSIQF